jgi:hypothetical protein
MTLLKEEGITLITQMKTILLIASGANAQQWPQDQVPCNDEGQGQGYYNQPNFSIEQRIGRNIEQRGPNGIQNRGNF